MNQSLPFSSIKNTSIPPECSEAEMESHHFSFPVLLWYHVLQKTPSVVDVQCARQLSVPLHHKLLL